MARKVFIAATGQDCGKTTTSLSLLHLARQKYRRVGFIKPVGPKPSRYNDFWVDKDAALVAKVFDLEYDIRLMSPVVVQPGDTRKVLDGVVTRAQLEQQLVAYAYIRPRNNGKRYNIERIGGVNNKGLLYLRYGV